MSEELLTIADRVVGWANEGEQLEVVVVNDKDTEVRVYEGQVESFTASTSQGVGIRVIKDNRQGFAYAGSLDEDVIKETLADARDNATFGTPDEFLGLVEPDGVPIADLVLYDDTVNTFETEKKIALAIELERQILDGDQRVSGVESSDYVDSVSEAAIASTAGVRVHGRDGGCYLAASVMATEGDDTQTGFGFSVGRGPEQLDAGVAATDAIERATRMLGATQPASERVTVVLDPYVTAQFLSIIGRTLSGESVLKGRSLFADRIGETVANPLIHLIDDPTDVRAFSATEVDGEGLATRRNELIVGGVLQQFVQNSYTGRRSGTASTGSAIRGYSSTPGTGCMALQLVPGTRQQPEIIADIDNGILIQGVSGLHSGVNTVSGDFSTGAEGLRITNGALGEPVREFTIASTLQRMLLDVAEVGGDVDWLPMSAAGVSLVVHDVSVSGT